MTELSGSLLEPIDVDPAALLALHAASPDLYPALFESAAAGEPLGRFDILFAHPAVASCAGATAERFLPALDRWWQREREAAPGATTHACRSRAVGSSTWDMSLPARSSLVCAYRNRLSVRSRRRFAFLPQWYMNTTAVAVGSSLRKLPPT
jgi:hypothetical protein